MNKKLFCTLLFVTCSIFSSVVFATTESTINLPNGLPVAFAITPAGQEYVAIHDYHNNVTLWTNSASTPNPEWAPVPLDRRVFNIKSMTTDDCGNLIVTTLLSDDNNVDIWKYNPTDTNNKWVDLTNTSFAGVGKPQFMQMNHNYKHNLITDAIHNTFAFGRFELSNRISLLQYDCKDPHGPYMRFKNLKYLTGSYSQSLLVKRPTSEDVYVLNNSGAISRTDLPSFNFPSDMLTPLPGSGYMDIWAATVDDNNHLYVLMSDRDASAPAGHEQDTFLRLWVGIPVKDEPTTYTWKDKLDRLDKVNPKAPHSEQLVLANDGRLYFSYSLLTDNGMARSYLGYFDTTEPNGAVSASIVPSALGSNYYPKSIWVDAQNHLFVYFAPLSAQNTQYEGVWEYTPKSFDHQWVHTYTGQLYFPEGSAPVIADPADGHMYAIGEDGAGHDHMLDLNS